MGRIIITCLMLGTAVSIAQAGARDYFTETAKDFGVTARGPMLTHYFAVKNSTDKTVTIGQPRVSCGCVSARVLKSQLAPGESTYVAAYMDSRKIPQSNTVRTVTVFVPFLTPIHEEVQLKVSALARDDLVLSPDSLALGTVRKGQGGNTSVKVSFYGGSNWRIVRATSTGAYVEPKLSDVKVDGGTVSYEVTAELDPACPVGNWTADVWLETEGAGIGKFRIPVTVNVVPPISVNPGTVTLNDMSVGETSEQRVILQGNLPFKVLEVKGGDDQLSAKPLADEARPVQILTIKLTASQAGNLSKVLEIITDHEDQPTLTVPVKANISGK